jgi:2-polyprenyl-6-hydroxyphenyl methylase/3-demethylubiquinone-9 3-methyltransferase
MIDTRLHVWDLFITPDELTGVLRRHQLRPDEITGLGPRRHQLGILRDFVRARRGRLSYGELSRRLDIGQVRGLAVSYMGFAVKG